MNQRQAVGVVGAAVVLAATAVAWWLAVGRPGPQLAEPQPAAEAGVAPGDGVATVLYFPDGRGRLGSETRELAPSAGPEERIAQVVEAVLAGPVTDDLFQPLESEVQLTDVHLAPDGVAFVDLGSATLAAPPVAGSRGEMQAVYSFVNSILSNVPAARAVVLLWNGQQRPTFAGHLDTTRPLTARRDWLASG